MKTLFKNLTVLAILVSPMISCDEIEDLIDVKKSVVLSENFTVDLNGGDDSIESQDLDISILTSAVKPYADLLKKVEIEKVTFQILNYSGDDAAEFEVKFSADGTLFMDESFVASSAASNSTIFEVTDSTGLNTLASKLLNNENVTIAFSAESKNLENPASFTVQAKFYIEVTANPLN